MAVQEEGLSAFLSEERGRMDDFDDKVCTNHHCGRRHDVSTVSQASERDAT